MSSLRRLRSGLMSFRPLLKALSQSVAVAGITRASKANWWTSPLGCRGLRTRSARCRCRNAASLHLVGHGDGVGCVGEEKLQIIQKDDYPVTIPWLYHFGRNLYYYRNSGGRRWAPGPP